MSKILAFLIAVFPIVLPFVFESTASAQSSADWQLIWSDEFNGTAGSAPNSQYWTLQQGLTSDGAQSYNCLYGQTTNGCDPSNPNVYLDGNGNLAIVARAAAGAPNGITTGRLTTSSGANNSPILFGTQYGRIEAGMTLPVNAGNQGVWPAFWMLGNNISAIDWPACGEIDIMEYVGASNPTTIFSTLHGEGYSADGLAAQTSNASGWGGYHIFGAIWSPNQVQFYVDDITNIVGVISTADIAANQSWINGGQSAWPFNNPFFLLLDLNMGGPFPGNVSGATTFPQTLLVDYVRVYQAAAPGSPTNVTAAATSQSQVALTWTASTNNDTTYNIYRSAISGTAPQSQAQPNPAVLPQSNATLIANNISGTAYTDANLSPGQTYFYTVTSSGGYSGESVASQVQVTLPASGVGSNGGSLSVSAAGYSGTGTYIQNSLVSGGFTDAFTAAVDTSAVTNPAPQDVYHTERWGAQTWTIAHLTPGGSYNLRMHFAESTWTAPGERQFDVLVNGILALSNFDIYATAGAQNTVVSQTINTIADQNGVISLQLAQGAADQPEIRALDVTPSTGGVAMGDPAGTSTYVAIDSGGPTEGLYGEFQADDNVGDLDLPQNPFTSGGATDSTLAPVSIVGILDPAPQAVYQTERYGAFGYTVTGLIPSSIYSIRLHFAETTSNYTSAGDRLFNVSVNGNQVLTNYDIFANAGSADQAVIPQVLGISNEYGMISIQMSPGAAYLPSLRGVELIWSGVASPSSGSAAPAPPTGLTATTLSANLINLAWTASTTSGVQYEIFRSTSAGFTPSSATLLSATSSTSYADSGLVGGVTYYYVVEAAASGTSAPSNQASATTTTSSASANNAPDFGPNVFVLDPSMPSAQVTQLLTSLSNEDQFGANRWAVLFMPGTYSVQAPVGYYESIAGLGETPGSVTINGFLSPNFGTSYPGANVTDNFWRSMENMAFNPTTDSAQNGPANTLQWGVSQAAPLRRIQINGGLELTDSYCGYASGGFISDTVVTGNVNPCSQQQWYTRNSTLGSWNGGVWNMVFSGVQGAPTQSFPTPPETVLATTPVSREKPFLYVDGSGNYNVFVPTVLTNSSGVSWSGGGLGTGYSLSLSSFFIAQPSNTLAQINAALAAGQNLLLTPGIYQYSGSINVTNANTIVLGLGYATLIPQAGTSALTVADVDGVQVAGIIIDAGPVNSSVLMEVGNPDGSAISHQANPTSLNDVYIRIGGAEAGTASTSLQIDSNNVILDDIWAWRADHGNGVGWTANTAANGLIVNGNNVTALGLAVEHYQQTQVQWNGNGGETIFYQSELPYDPPSQSEWMDGTANGYPSYSVSPAVTSHLAYGLGVYSYFSQGVNIIEDNAITVPNAAGVLLNDLVTVFLNGNGQITNIVNGVGTIADLGNDGQPQDLVSYGGQTCTAAGTTCPTVSLPAALGNLTATAISSSQINLIWTTNGNTAVTYSVFRSITSGFTANTATQVATGLQTTAYSDTGLASGTTYYYVVEATNTAGNSSPSSQTSATTFSIGPAAPSNLIATEVSASQVNLAWTASATSGVTYNVFRAGVSGFAPGAANLIASGVGSTSYSDTGIAANASAAMTYYYVVEAVNAAGTSASNQASVTLPSLCSPACTDGLDINSGGSTTGSYLADEDFAGGSASSTSATINTSLLANPAPQGVYQSERFGDFTYTLPNLTPGGSYVLNLHFAEIYWTQAGQRQFNVIVNGTTVLTNFDIFAIAGGENIAIVESFPVTASSAGTVTIQFATGNADLPKVSGIELMQVTSAQAATDIQIDAGGVTSGTWLADEYFAGGSAASTTASINTSLVSNAAPQAVYQTERYGDFIYTIPGLTPGASYNVNLHFAEIYWNAVGDRQFNVLINGATVLTNFDIFAAAGGEDIAIVKSYTATASSMGTVTIQFTTGAADQPKVSGIQIVSP
jgi:beta-glucanase (GH16 family)